MARCRSCQAEIIWCFSERGKKIPLDHTPVATGNLVLIKRKAPLPDLARAPQLDDGDRPRYVAHFVTCPNAAEFRRKPGAA